jgi:hypothetical protein
MKRYLNILLIPYLLLNCKHEPAPLPAIKEIVGKWRLDAVETTINGQTVWEKANDTPPVYIVFRFDGVILNSDGLRDCCAPDSLIVNGTPFKIKPAAEILSNPQCAYVYCMPCSPWDLKKSDNELILTRNCGNKSRFRYFRN